MDYFCKCKYCKYIDPTERAKGYKWYCEWYHCYEDPDEIKECKHFVDASSGRSSSSSISGGSSSYSGRSSANDSVRSGRPSYSNNASPFGGASRSSGSSRTGSSGGENPGCLASVLGTAFWILVLAIALTHCGPSSGSDDSYEDDPVPQSYSLWDEYSRSELIYTEKCSKKAAKTYAAVLMSMQAGTNSDTNGISFENYQMWLQDSGLLYAAVLDMDDSGQPELVCVYNGCVCVYTYANDTAVPVIITPIGYSGSHTDVYARIWITQRGQRWIRVDHTQDGMKEERFTFYSLKDGQAVTEEYLARSKTGKDEGGWTNVHYKINGQSVSKAEFCAGEESYLIRGEIPVETLEMGVREHDIIETVMNHLS